VVTEPTLPDKHDDETGAERASSAGESTAAIELNESHQPAARTSDRDSTQFDQAQAFERTIATSGLPGTDPLETEPDPSRDQSERVVPAERVTKEIAPDPGGVTRPASDGSAAASPPDLTYADDISQDLRLPASQLNDRVLGNYKLIRVLGKGGMGVVYEALHLDLNRRVALKAIRSDDLSSQDDLVRFRNESQAVADLDHVGIVPIYEVGASPDHHYFIMKLMEHGSLAERLNQYAENPRTAASVMVTVARAIHHAHQRGILHRDLKPGNILLDGDGRPHVSDFGLAKRVESDSDLTRSGAILGTPSYMAPEQTSQVRNAVTTAVDVYGLGATLYALLTTRPPFRGDTVLETIHLVRTQAPEAPSSLNSRVDLDLETICLKCLEKDPRQRYASGEAVAEDLERWLTGQPIAARPVSGPARAWRWCRSNRMVAGLLAALALLFVLGFAGVTWQAIRAERQKDRAERERADALQQRLRAEENFGLARRAVDDLLTKVSENQLIKQPGFQMLRAELLRAALDYYRDFTRRRGDDPAIHGELAEAYVRMGQIAKEIGTLEEAEAYYKSALDVSDPQGVNQARGPDNPALSLARAKAFAGLSMVLIEGGQFDRGMRSAEQSQEIYTSLRRIRPSDPDLQQGLAEALRLIGRSLDGIGRFDDSERVYEKANTLVEALVGDNPSEIKQRELLADVYFERALHHGKNVAKTTEAEQYYRKAIAVREAMVHDHPNDIWLKYRLALTDLFFGEFLGSYAGRWNDSLDLFGRATELIGPLARDNPKVGDFLYYKGMADYEIGYCYLKQGHYDKAVAHYRRALEAVATCTRENPNVTRYESPGLFGIYQDIAEAQRLMGDLPAALQSLREAEGHLQIVLRKSPDDYIGLFHKAMVNRYLSNVYSELGDPEHALQTARLANEVLDPLARKAASDLQTQQELTLVRMALGQAHRGAGQLTPALAAYEQAARQLEELCAGNPSSIELRGRLGVCLGRISAIERLTGKLAKAELSWKRGRDLLTELNLPDPVSLVDLARTHALHIPLISPVKTEAGLTEAERAARQADVAQAIKLLNNAVAAGYKNRAGLVNDPDFQPLHGLAAFQALFVSQTSVK